MKKITVNTIIFFNGNHSQAEPEMAVFVSRDAQRIHIHEFSGYRTNKALTIIGGYGKPFTDYESSVTNGYYHGYTEPVVKFFMGLGGYINFAFEARDAFERALYVWHLTRMLANFEDGEFDYLINHEYVSEDFLDDLKSNVSARDVMAKHKIPYSVQPKPKQSPTFPVRFGFSGTILAVTDKEINSLIDQKL